MINVMFGFILGVLACMAVAGGLFWYLVKMDNNERRDR